MTFRRPFLLAALFPLLITACGQPGETVPSPDLTPQFGSAGNDRADIVVTDPQRGRVYLAGTTGSDTATGTGGNAFFRSYDRAGRLVWERRANNPGAAVAGVAVGPGGNAVFGWRTDKSFVTKYNPAGTRLSQLVLRGVGISSLALDDQGNIYVAEEPNVDLDNLPFVRKYSAGGGLLWRKQLKVPPGDDYDGPRLRTIEGLAATPDGSLYLSGRSGEEYGFLVKLRGRDGALLGQRELPSAGFGVATNGNDALYVLVGNEDIIAGGTDYTVYRFRPDLSLLWGQRELVEDRGESSEDDDPLALATDTQGSVYLTGVYNGRDGADYFVRKFSAAGDLVFDRRASVPGSDAEGLGVAALNSSELYLVGTTTGKVNGRNYGGQDAFLIRTDGRGREIWAR